MKVLVIGGAGYLGIVLCDKLKNTNRDVIVYDKFLYSKYNDLRQDLQIISDDVCNIENHKEIFNDVDVVYYLSSPRLLDIVDESQILNELENLKKVINLLRPNMRFFFNSSCSVYGKNDEIVNEMSQTYVTSLYSKLKLESEKILLNVEGPIIKILRLSTLYGKSKIERNDILINKIVNDISQDKKNIEIFDSESKRPHLHINDCANIMINLINADYDEKIINIGFNKLNISKRDLIKIIEKTLNTNLNVTYYETQDSRSYYVDFSLLRKLTNYQYWNYERGIFDLYFKESVVFSLEDWDSIINYHRPNASSQTWYLKEEGKIDIPKMWGNWNVVNTESENKMFEQSMFKELVTPHFYFEYVSFKTKNEIIGKKHVYFINVYDPNFFYRNSEIGFKCISKEYIQDIKQRRCDIVINLIMEGYSGTDNNKDLEFIDKWIKEIDIPDESVHYISANLMIEEKVKEAGFKFNCIPVVTFDNWINYHEARILNPVEFEPKENKFLYLSYNRNPRNHRITFVSKLLSRDLLNLGKISMNTFHLANYNELPDDNPKKRLRNVVPIMLDKSLDINWANDITQNDYKDTFISIVTESLTDKGTLFLSEKIFKPIAMGHPFMVLGNVGTLKKLKELGFMTFEKWFDESYDNEPNMEIRCDMIINEIEKFKNKTIDELKKIRDEMKDICTHNQKFYIKMVESKYTFNGENHNGLKQILLIVKTIYDRIPNGNSESNFTFNKKLNII